MDSPSGSEPLSPEEDFYGNDEPDASDAPRMDTITSLDVTAALDSEPKPVSGPILTESAHLDGSGASEHDETHGGHLLANGAAPSEHSTDSHAEDHSSSDMDMSDSDREPKLDATLSSPAQQEPTHDQSTPAMQKRKLSDTLDEFQIVEALSGEISSKKLRLSTASACSIENLTPELLQQVFTRLSPAMLCRCRRVCRRFDQVLTLSLIHI